MAVLTIQTDDGTFTDSVAFDDALLDSPHFATKMGEEGLIVLQQRYKDFVEQGQEEGDTDVGTNPDATPEA